jgi:hypothetical protein
VSRRAALRAIAAGAGATAGALWVNNLIALAEQEALHAHVVAPSLQLGAAWTSKVLSAPQLQTVGILVELIIPTTETPGAKAVFVDRFVDSVLETAAAADRDRFLAGLTWLDTRSTALFQAPFSSATNAQQADLLTRLAASPSSEAPAGVDFFTAIKGMTITGYYTTEVGLRQELGDDGRLMSATFEGCTHAEHQM